MGADRAAVRPFLVDLAAFLLGGSAEGVFQARQHVVEAGRRYGVRADVLILPDQMVLTIDDGNGQTVDLIETAPGLSLDRMEQGKRLAADIEAGLPLAAAVERLAAIVAAPPPYPPWLRVAGVVLFSVGFAPSVVGSIAEVAVTLVLALVMGVLFVAFSGRRWEPLLPLIGSFAVACLALTVFADVAERVGPVLLMVPALFVVIPGDYLSAAAGELAVGRISAGASRLVWALFLLVELIVGIALAAQVTGAQDWTLNDGTAPGTLPFWVIVLAWIPFTLGLAWAFNAGMRNVPVMAALVMTTYLLYAGTAKLAGDVIGTLVAGTVAGLAATILARRPQLPPRLELILGPFFTLTVGSLGLRGVTQLISGHPIGGAKTLTDFLLIVPTVAFALLIGYLLASSPRLRRNM